MSAETLRRAAALMRERAEAARAGRWVAEGEHVLAQWTDVRHVAECSGSLSEGNDANAEHIASWHPDVALAVADWLDAAYERWRFNELSLSAQSVRAMSGGTNEPDPYAIAVARAYLGEA